jgi:hypothetical protein
MALTINSPGVQIVETDLSNYLNIVNGTTVFIAGYAPQGPTDEVLQITSTADLENIYGTPTTPAERYFYYSAKQVLNSPGNLLTTRLPYGSGSGYGFTANEYSALFFPVASGTNSFTLGEPTHVTLNEGDYTKLKQGNFTWGNYNSGTTATTTTTGYTLSSLTVNTAAAMTTINSISSAQLSVGIIPEVFTETINGNGTVTFTFNNSITSASVSVYTPTSASWTGSVANAGLIILNDSQTTINEYFEGYYLTVSDNSTFGPNKDFNAVSTLKTLTDADKFYSVPSTRLGFSLSATSNTPGNQSVSQQIERAFSYDFGNAAYNDCLTINLFKVRNSIYDPSQLTISPVETYVGSLNSRRKIADSNGGTLKSFFIGDAVNGNSNNITALINTNLSNNSIWNTNTTVGGVSAVAQTSGVYAEGVFKPAYNSNSNKLIGNVYSKVNRALTLIDTPENITVDIIADAGLSTIFANTATQSGTPTSGCDDATAYNDISYVDTTGLDQTLTPVNQYWSALFQLFDTFVTQTRKDCVFIADPLRQIFVNGKDTKTLSVKSNTFTGNIYNPLKATVGEVNSNYSVIYGNWVKVYDQFSDAFTWLPASGFVSSIYAKSDAATQPWFAPAGLNRGIIQGIVDIGVNPNQKQRDYLYLISVNPIAFFNGDGYVVYGQKTLQSKPSAFDRVNVRRLFLTLERAVQKSVKYFVFEPNTDFTRTRLKNTITPIFDLAKNTQGLYDYLIVCDTRNNTPDVIDRNELAVDIYIKPVKAAEFILVNFIATTTGQNFSELI